MRVVSGVAIFFYTVVFIVLGSGLVALSLNLVTQEEIRQAVDYLDTIPNVRIIVGVAGGFLILISLVLVQLVTTKMQMEKTIAFENPEGQVTISLSAIEDLIRRLAKNIPEIKELRPTVTATKNGIDIVNRLVLYSDAHIPNITERIQSMIKIHVQDMLGIEETILVKVHINKIVHKEEKKSKRPDELQEKVPFRGIEYSSGKF